MVLDGPWMGEIPDDVRVCRMAIPGAHDAATGTLNTAVVRNFAKTQALTIDELWDAGVRAFDLRPALVDGELGIYHDKYYTGATLSGVLETLVGKLESQPSEFAIIIIRHEEEADGDAEEWGSEMSTLLASLPSDRVVKKFRPDLTLGDVRGRMLVLSRQVYDETPCGGYINGWYSGNSLQRQKMASVGGSELWVQDYYNPSSSDEKWECFRNLAEDFASQSDDVWCINHCSGYLSEAFGLPDYASNAASQNYLASENPSLLFGIIMMDFAGTDTYNSRKVYGATLLSKMIDSYLSLFRN